MESFEDAFLNAFLAGINEDGRGFANAAEAAVMESAEGYHVNLYAMSTSRFGDTLIRVGMSYAHSGRVKLSVRNPGAGKKLFLRVPSWSEGMTVTVNGETKPIRAYERVRGYAVLPLGG